MMAVQNFGFYMMYYPIFLSVPVMTACNNMRYWTGFFAIDCFVESFCCLWMAMGGYMDSTCMFAFGWILHLLVALPYCISTVGIPVVIYSADGESCRTAMGPSGQAVVPVFWTHLILFGVYVRACVYQTRATAPLCARPLSRQCCALAIPACQVWMMLSITWYSFVKPTFFNKNKNKSTVSVA